MRLEVSTSSQHSEYATEISDGNVHGPYRDGRKGFMSHMSKGAMSEALSACDSRAIPQ